MDLNEAVQRGLRVRQAFGNTVAELLHLSPPFTPNNAFHKCDSYLLGVVTLDLLASAFLIFIKAKPNLEIDPADWHCFKKILLQITLRVRLSGGLPFRIILENLLDSSSPPPLVECDDIVELYQRESPMDPSTSSISRSIF